MPYRNAQLYLARGLTDEEAFHLADIGGDQEDTSDYERAVVYVKAIKLYCGGAQKAMAERANMCRWPLTWA